MQQKQFSRARLYLHNKEFSPKITHILIVLLMLAVLINLGLWQLKRADYKRQLLQSYELQKHDSPLTFAQLQQKLKTQPALKSLRYQKVHLTGRFDDTHTIFLDNKFYQHQAGYEVLTPFFPVNNTSEANSNNKPMAFLVNRGWVPRGASRQKLPNVPSTRASNISIDGILYIPPRKPFVLGADNLPAKPSWPLRVQSIKISQLQGIIGYRIYPFVIRSAPGQAGSFKYNWQPVIVHPEKHIGYAIQWFAFAAVLLIVFIAVNVKPKRKETY